MPTRELPQPQDQMDRDILAAVAEYGWFILGIEEDEEGPAYGFTVGLYHSFDHPEIVITGLPHATSERLLKQMGDEVRAGGRYEVGKKVDGIVEDFPVMFMPVEKNLHREYLGYAVWFYRSPEFPALQCVWPDKAGRFPNEAGYDLKAHALQPLLNEDA